jgi:hypothetical protein
MWVPTLFGGLLSMPSRQNIKDCIKRNWKPFTVGVVFTGIIFIVTRRFTTRYLVLNGTSTIIRKAIITDDAALYKVFNIYNLGFKNQGLSWMVKCKETGKSFASQQQAARVMGLSKHHISNHLNGSRTNVNGYHFERLGVGA